MKKLLTAKSLSFLMLLSLLSGKVEANRHYDNDGYVEDRGGNCCGGCYECGCNPLYCGAWDLQVQAGVAPIIWRNRGDWFRVNSTGGVVVVAEGPKFSRLFKTPWTVGGQVGYHMSDNTRVYLEFNYLQANRKSAVDLLGFIAPITAFSVTTARYKVFDGYVGARYYWDRWCDRVSFFLGGKVGFTHHKRNNFDLTLNALALTDTTVYNRNTVVAGGADFGLDFCFCGNWSFVITGAVIASCGPRAAAPIAAAIVSINTNLFPGGIGTELRFPVTAGVRYSF